MHPELHRLGQKAHVPASNFEFSLLKSVFNIKKAHFKNKYSHYSTSAEKYKQIRKTLKEIKFFMQRQGLNKKWTKRSFRDLSGGTVVQK